MSYFHSLQVEKDQKSTRLYHPLLPNGKVTVASYLSPQLTGEVEKLTTICDNHQIILSTSKTNERLYYQIKHDSHLFIGATRKVMIDTLYNCRDLGGYLTVEGSMTRWGKLFRSDALDHLTATDQNCLKNMGVTSIIDLRTPTEIDKRPNKLWDSLDYHNFNPKAEVAKAAGEMQLALDDKAKIEKLESVASTVDGQKALVAKQDIMTEQMYQLVTSKPAKSAYSDFLHYLISTKANEETIIFHCQGGKDRTGWGAALILGLLGVPKETIYADYLLTNDFNKQRNDKRMEIYQHYTDNSFVLNYLRGLQLTTVEYLDGAFNVLEEKYGTFENYASKELNFNLTNTNELKKRLLYQTEDFPTFT